ncbi:UDP-glucose flavonoid 3-O-glucosyltransferase 7-like [Arachis stenosperma]|uniref:UDP-glucose flavonoid 3-O-glucosyltransferase 7-like n=1 Tax=Arachis stenosperma TaxID=217475 RepID=UPI0025AD610C|nr:UDP-glucose flavonoid 3-O-glucosyltransferase 7-like [Arachis stenosperma]
MTKSTSRPLKIHLLPYYARGHQIPVVHLARFLASRGQHVTIITTPSNARLIDKAIIGGGGDHDNASDRICIHTINFPAEQVGLPPGVENFSDVVDNSAAGKLCIASHLIQLQVESFIEESLPDALIADIMFTWSQATARRFKIPRLTFNPLLIFDMCVVEAIRAHPEILKSNTGPYTIPGLPHKITFPVKPMATFNKVMEPTIDAEKESLGVIVNSFKELDAEYAEHYEKITGRRVWHIGPTDLMVHKTVPRAVDSEHECLKWLSTKKNSSVVYVAFGSLARLTDKQLYELALGLERSGHPFIWVVSRNKNNRVEETEGKWLPEGFEETMKKEGRGMVITEWVPQPLILNHAAIGAFLTHCGTNSVNESVAAGVPMITMPTSGDQYFIEKVISEVHGIGVEVGAVEWIISQYDTPKEVVSAEMIEKAVKRLMDGGDEAEKIRKRAKELQEKALKAVEEGGSSYNTLTELIDHLQKLVALKAPATST